MYYDINTTRKRKIMGLKNVKKNILLMLFLKREKCVKKKPMFHLEVRIKILVNTDISVLEFYGYIKNIGKILMDIFINIGKTEINKYILKLMKYFEKV